MVQTQKLAVMEGLRSMVAVAAVAQEKACRGAPQAQAGVQEEMAIHLDAARPVS
ncbi:hypothetical protein ACT3TY_05370 [Halomonas sp. AOP22-C1-8]|uniref:hypothetical protein n=1 Tax=Halomonas sp. AOP22-C1-8 TaxID=3457717 RepID=UPI004033A5BC